MGQMFKAWCLTPGADFRGSLGSDNAREMRQTVVLVTVRTVKTHGKTAGVHSGAQGSSHSGLRHEFGIVKAMSLLDIVANARPGKVEAEQREMRLQDEFEAISDGRSPLLPQDVEELQREVSVQMQEVIRVTSTNEKKQAVVEYPCELGRESQDRTATWNVAFGVQQSISCEGCNYNCNQRWHCASRKCSRNSIVGNNCSVVLGSTGRDKESQPTAVKSGDKVFHSKCRGPKAMLGNKDSLLFRDGATLETHAKMPSDLRYQSSSSGPMEHLRLPEDGQLCPAVIALSVVKYESPKLGTTDFKTQQSDFRLMLHTSGLDPEG
ncbi:hypothetical protein U0070_006097 [Myodes glareolus]|uniref:Uncharacterized protein n=1 Tax=Myodes glareolus TaxID=447135 RepID=A0AAW0IA80_MYOGA